MLKILRNKKTAKKVWIGLAIIIIPAFALWGFGGAGRSREETAPAGKIFGRNISFTEFRDAIGAEKIMAIMRFGDKLSEVQQYLNLEAQAWERLILLAEAKKRRITAGDQEVIEDIENSPYFQLRGAFNNKIYNEILRYSLRVQPRIFEELTRQNLIISKLYKQVADKVSLNDEQIKKEYAQANQEMSIYYVAGLVSDFAKNISTTEKEIYDYYQANKPMFKQPTVINKEKTEARIPELTEIKDKVRQAFIQEVAKKSADKKIKECLSQLATEELLAAGRKLGLKTGSTGSFKYGGFIDGLGPAQVFWEAAYGLKENQPSRIISLPAGFYIIKIKSMAPVDEARFTKEKADFARKILLEQKQNYFNSFVEKLKKKA
jgi:hypothetical protein